MIQLVGDIFGLPPDVGENVAVYVMQLYAETFDTLLIIDAINQRFPDRKERDLAFFLVGRMHILAEFCTERETMDLVLNDFSNFVNEIRSRPK